MVGKLDTIIVVDVESTSWEGNPPKGQESEIIEIGIATLDVASLERKEKESVLVRPFRSAVSEFATKLTTLTQQQVDGGIPFRDACSVLQSKYRARDRLWASWGDYDRRMFERQCQSMNVPYPFGKGHLNVKTLFATVHGLPHELGMAEALELLKLPLEGTHHRGGDDAWNIALLLAGILSAARNRG